MLVLKNTQKQQCLGRLSLPRRSIVLLRAISNATSGKYSRFWPDFDRVNVLCLDRPPIAHNCGRVYLDKPPSRCSSLPERVGSQTIFPALFALMHKFIKAGQGGVFRLFTRAFQNLVHAMRTRLSNSHPCSPTREPGYEAN